MIYALWFKLGFLALLFVSALLLVLGIANRPTRDMRQLGLRGLRRRRALARYEAWRFLEPGVRWAAAGISRFVPEPACRNLDEFISKAGDPLGLEAEELIVFMMLTSLVGASAGALYAATGGTPGAIIILAFGLGVFPWVRISSLAAERTTRIQRGLPNVVDLLCLGLSAGLDFPGAVKQIVEKSGDTDDPMIDEMSLLLSELHLGKTRREALEQLAARNPIDAIKSFVGFVIQSEEEGNPLAQILSVQAQVSRQRRTVRAEEMAGKASLQIIVPVGLIMLCVLIMIAGPLLLKVTSEMDNGF